MNNTNNSHAELIRKTRRTANWGLYGSVGAVILTIIFHFSPFHITYQQPQVSAGAQLLGAASTLTGEPVKESNTKKIILIVLIVLLALAAIAFVVFLIVARIRRERRRKARAAARRKKKMQQERIARQRAAELDRDR